MQLTNSSVFFFNDTATTEIYTLSLHDALPISTSPATAWLAGCAAAWDRPGRPASRRPRVWECRRLDRKSTRLNSSHGYISYAVFCLKKKTPQLKLHANRVLVITPYNTAEQCLP